MILSALKVGLCRLGGLLGHLQRKAVLVLGRDTWAVTPASAKASAHIHPGFS
jgi:hypothetical protein